MRGDLRIFKLFGIDVKLHVSWWLIVVLLSYSLATGFFPIFYPQFSGMTLWTLGVVSALSLFLSVLLHEFSHSLIGKWRNIQVDSITLFFFGGVSGIHQEEIPPLDEFLMAVAGPLFSLVLAAVCYLIFTVTLQQAVFLNALMFYLFQLNLILAIFNLLPAFPLDGGRAFRAILFAITKDLRKATAIASWGGRLFALLLFILGIVQLIAKNYSGIWFLLVGLFLHIVAKASTQQVILQQILKQWKVSDFTLTGYPKLQSSHSFYDAISAKLAGNDTLFLVTHAAKVTGILNTKNISGMQKAIEKELTVADLQDPFTSMPSLRTTDLASKAFHLLLRSKHEVLPVYKPGKKKQFVGLLSKEQLLHAVVWNLKFAVSFRTEKSDRKVRRARQKSTRSNRKGSLPLVPNPFN